MTRKSSEEFFFLHENDFVYKPERLPDDLKSLINDLNCLINSSGSFLESGDKGFLVNCLVSISNLLEEKHILNIDFYYKVFWIIDSINSRIVFERRARNMNYRGINTLDKFRKKEMIYTKRNFQVGSEWHQFIQRLVEIEEVINYLLWTLSKYRDAET